jgi:hypothetical protein
MEPRLSLITLGVADVARARKFYEALGFKAGSASNESVTFLDAGGVVLALFGRSALAEDAAVADNAPGFSGIALAHNARSEADVNKALAAAAAGRQDVLGRLLRLLRRPRRPLVGGGAQPLFHVRRRRSRRPRHVSNARMNHDRYSDDYIADILRDARVFAFVGASANTSRPSYFAMKYLLGKGYTIHPVNPGIAAEKLLGQQVYGALADLPAPVDVIDIFRNSEVALPVTREAIALKDKLGLKVLWMQLGVRNDEAAAEAEAAGLKVVMNRCPKIEYGRLSGEIAWAGVNSGQISSVRPKLAPTGVQSLSLGKR